MRLGDELPAAADEALQRLDAAERAQRINRGCRAIDGGEVMHDAHDDDIGHKRQLRDPAAALSPHDALAIVLGAGLGFEWNDVGCHVDPSSDALPRLALCARRRKAGVRVLPIPAFHAATLALRAACATAALNLAALRCLATHITHAVA